MVKLATSGGSNGKKQSNSKSSMLKLQHIQNVAKWSTQDANLPSLAAFFGRRFAACAEELGVSTDDSLFTCERCETILQPGENCTVRIEKSKANNGNKHKGSKVPTQNNVVYRCHFCSHQNVKRGTLKGHMKRIYPPKDELAPKPKVKIPMISKSVSSCKNIDDTETCTRESSCAPKILENMVKEPWREHINSAFSDVEVAVLDNIESDLIPQTPAPAPAIPPVVTSSLLDTKKRKRNKSVSKKEPEINSTKTDISDTIGSVKKRKRKTWTSLKDSVKNSQTPSSKNLADITIPFIL